jgi:type IV pili sensor histidine kinase/response regulator
MSGVSGDMDAVLKLIVETAARDSAVAGVSSTIDASACVVRVTAVALPPAPAPVVATPAAQAPAVTAPAARTAAASSSAATGAASVQAPAVPVPAPASPVWAARRGSTLRQSLESWASKANCTAPDARIAGQSTWSLAWAATDVDYRIAAPLTFDGSISDAAQSLIRLYANADVRLGLRVHPNQCVLHVFAAGRN